jgi:signal peptidase I
MHSEEKKEPRTLSWQQNAVLYFHDLVYLLAVLMIVFLMFFRVVVVEGTSMNQTLLDGDYLLLLNSTFYGEPEQGDIVVISKDSYDHGVPIVKRVIATEGQIVDIDFETGTVYVDGVALVEPYLNTPTNVQGGVQFPLEVEDSCVFVMGDNRNRSKDSRYYEIGMIDTREILGKAIFLVLPGTNKGEFTRDFTRIGGLS